MWVWAHHQCTVETVGTPSWQNSSAGLVHGSLPLTAGTWCTWGVQQSTWHTPHAVDDSPLQKRLADKAKGCGKTVLRIEVEKKASIWNYQVGGWVGAPGQEQGWQAVMTLSSSDVLMMT
jgi:hypothetical protein